MGSTCKGRTRLSNLYCYGLIHGFVGAENVSKYICVRMGV